MIGTTGPFGCLKLGCLALGLALGVQAAPAIAQTATQSTYPAEVENNCRDDYFRYCSPYALGSDELRRCMEAKAKTLSPNCQQALLDNGYAPPGLRRRGS